MKEMSYERLLLVWYAALPTSVLFAFYAPNKIAILACGIGMTPVILMHMRVEEDFIRYMGFHHSDEWKKIYRPPNTKEARIFLKNDESFESHELAIRKKEYQSKETMIKMMLFISIAIPLIVIIIKNSI
ncbi:hypothetical protein [Pelagicoccus albus]|uniref:Uncharacterized protein n=1 Tax=Pelagicoccus albus TaxID=415222 RepID=A0A7X1B371_9BACT|nr:hypothetical protein [Pelagicoccus albus]MBC2604814.1 hypothetical protein [Pelagicoccus albus]